MERIENKYTLKYEEELLPFMETIHALYTETSISDVVFRSTLSAPPTLIDSTPQSKRENEEGIIEEKIIMTNEEVALLSEQDKRDFVGERSLSVFKTKEKCLRDITSIVNHIADKYSLEEAEAYLNIKRGPFIVKLQLSKEVGLIEKKFNRKGHKNILLNEGVIINDYIVESYPPVDIEELLNEENLNKYRSQKFDNTSGNDTPEG